MPEVHSPLNTLLKVCHVDTTRIYPVRIPEEARPSPLLPVVPGAEMVSSSDEDFFAAARGAAEIAGGNLLHNYLLTQNAPPLQDPKGAQFY